ncbi:hypothetical protein [Streptomyces sp. NPDC047985]|uniref:hypothetical protein n=1 Tax=unclassified Streptomyces TaxID=2593676 RepID=UPI0034218291
MTEAQRAQRSIGEEVTVPEQRWYAAMILDDVQSEVEKRSAELGAVFAEELAQARKEYLSGKER